MPIDPSYLETCKTKSVSSKLKAIGLIRNSVMSLTAKAYAEACQTWSVLLPDHSKDGRFYQNG